MRRIIGILLVLLAFTALGTFGESKQVNITVGDTAIQTMTVENPLSVEDEITIDFVVDSEFDDNINYWIEGYSRDKRNFEIGPYSNKTLHTMIEGAKCTKDTGCSGLMTIKATSSVSQLSGRRTLTINLTAPSTGKPIGSAPGLDTYAVIALAILGGTIFAFKRKENN